MKHASLKEGLMKTGNDAERNGLYVSECCEFEAKFRKGETLTRCPKCSSLTVWEFVEDYKKQAA
jgi:hypothetical protein